MNRDLHSSLACITSTNYTRSISVIQISGSRTVLDYMYQISMYYWYSSASPPYKCFVLNSVR